MGRDSLIFQSDTTRYWYCGSINSVGFEKYAQNASLRMFIVVFIFMTLSRERLEMNDKDAWGKEFRAAVVRTNRHNG